jgi:Asp-tRNA(Asn)/Glu-tRNA(Gln) amidotransferase A subunit family amidase
MAASMIPKSGGPVFGKDHAHEKSARGRAIKPLNELTATEIVAAIGHGRTTCEAIVHACLDRIAEREPTVHAWAHLDPEAALASARAFDESVQRGPLAGVPFGVKDIIDTFDMPTAWGTPIHRGRRPERDAACVALSRKAGGVLLGKTVTTEFANLHPGPTRNPHDPARTPAGSSSGSAAAVADFMVPIAIGTQTTGSTIRPASFCGVFGYRPTYGEHRMHGVMEASGSLDTLGILARSIEDVALYRNTLVEDAARQLTGAGATVSDASLPAGCERLNDAHRTISSFEFARTFTWEIEHHWDAISDTLRGGRLHDGIHGNFASYIEAKQVADECRRALDARFEDYDVLLTPAAFGEAPVGMAAFAGVPMFQIWTTLHVPAVSLPVFKGPNGLPIGAQLLAKRHADRKLFACAQWVWEKLT